MWLRQHSFILSWVWRLPGPDKLAGELVSGEDSPSGWQMDPPPHVLTWPLLCVCVVREKALTSLPLLIGTPVLLDQDPTLMTSFNLNYFPKEGLPRWLIGSDQCRRRGRSPGEGNGNPLQYSCLENPMDRGAWRATVHRVIKSQTPLNMHARISLKTLSPDTATQGISASACEFREDTVQFITLHQTLSSMRAGLFLQLICVSSSLVLTPPPCESL